MNKYLSDGLVFESDRPIEVHEMVWVKQRYQKYGHTLSVLHDKTAVTVRPVTNAQASTGPYITKTGRVLTDDDIEALSQKAEQGYDMSNIPNLRVNQGNPGKRKPWQFMTKFVITDKEGDPYLIRLRLIQTPYFGIMLHKFLRGDSDPYVHDHPWTFMSFILRGGYTEVRRDNFTHQHNLRHVKRFNLMRRDDAHYILALDRTPSWSLVLHGRRRRTWGFWKPKSLWDTPMQDIPDQTWIEFENWKS